MFFFGSVIVGVFHMFLVKLSLIVGCHGRG